MPAFLAGTLLFKRQLIHLKLCVPARAPVKNAEEDNSVAEVYLQLGPDALETRAVIDLLEQARSCRTRQCSHANPEITWWRASPQRVCSAFVLYPCTCSVSAAVHAVLCLTCL